MADTILQRFLDQALLDIGDDDEKFKHLQKASHDLTQRLQRKRFTVIPTTLAALDPEIVSDDPILVEAEVLLKKYWTTVRNRYGGAPRQLLRAILFDALQSAGRADTSVAAMIWLTGSSIAQHIDLRGETLIAEAWLQEMGTLAEARAVEEWSQPAHTPPTVPSFDLILTDIEMSKIDETAITKGMAAATGPTDEEGDAISPDPNSVWPNSGANWSHQFAPRAAAAIFQAVDQSQSAMQDYIDQVVKRLQAALAEHMAAVPLNNRAQAGAYERRTRLLWWKEALYSPTRKCSYRSLTAPVAALWMAYDLCDEVPPYCPQSVDFFLRETVRAVIGSEAETITLSAFCAALQESIDRSSLPRQLREKTGEAKRGSLLDLVRHALSSSPMSDTDVQSRLGIDAQTPMHLADLAVWLFHALQAQRLVEAK